MPPGPVKQRLRAGRAIRSPACGCGRPLGGVDRAPEHLASGGRLAFPVLTLSREETVLERARAAFEVVEHVEEQCYPLGEALVAQFSQVEQLAAEGSVRIARRGSRWWWATRIFVAYRR